jgi:hypothetical protein
MARIHHLAQQRAWTIFIIAQIPMEHLHDEQDHIQPNQVCERQRAHGVIHA